MYNYDQTNLIDTEPGMIPETKSIPSPDEIEFIRVHNIIDHTAIRKRTPRTLALTPGSGVYCPNFTFEGIGDFNIADVKLISEIDMNKKLSLKKLDLTILLKYKLIYSDGVNRLTQPDEALFELTLNNVYYPKSNMKCFTTYPNKQSSYISRGTEPSIEVEALVSSIGEMLCCCTGALIVDIEACFIISFIQETQLCIPSYKNIEREGI